MNTPLSSKDWEALSAYLDGQLSERDRTRLMQRMTADAELRRGLEELRQTKIMLRSARRRRAPRNFTLSPQMVPQQQRRRSWLQPVSGFSFASGLATVLLILTLAFEYLPGLQGLRLAAAPNTLAAQAPAAAPLASPSTGAKNFDTEPPSGNLPPVVVWNVPLGMGGGGSGQETPAASGMGGGPGGTEIIVPGTEATSVPPLDMTAAPTSEPPSNLTTEPTTEPRAVAGLQGPTPTDVPTLTGSGPILGIQPTQPAGQATTQPAAGASELSNSNPADRYAIHAPASSPTINLGGIQIGLALLALGLAGAAIYFRRRS